MGSMSASSKIRHSEAVSKRPQICDSITLPHCENQLQRISWQLFVRLHLNHRQQLHRLHQLPRLMEPRHQLMRSWHHQRRRLQHRPGQWRRPRRRHRTLHLHQRPHKLKRPPRPLRARAQAPRGRPRHQRRRRLRHQSLRRCRHRSKSRSRRRTGKAGTRGNGG